MSFIDLRGMKRDSMFLMAELLLAPDRAPVRVKVRNLNDNGAMVEADLRLRPGDRLAVQLRNLGPVGGFVAWTDGRRFGIAFDCAIDSQRARPQISGGHKEAPSYARAALSAPRHDGFNGRLRRI